MINKYRLKRFKEKKNIQQNILKSLVVKIKFHDFQSVTIEKSCPPEVFQKFWDKGQWTKELDDLMQGLLKQGLDKGGKPVRLLGMGFKLDHQKVDEALPIQLSLFA